MLKGLYMWRTTLLISVCGVYCTQVEYTPVVVLKGHHIKGLNGDGYAEFLGVPYGVIDKNNPFGPSKPHPGFREEFEATESKKCPQVENEVVVGTLDCLTVDIYVPSTANYHNRLPVLVWIQGAYSPVRAGLNDGSPYNLLRHDVIVVIINYRIDFYGFLCLDIPETPGNQGLKDQVLALRWINKHIEAFHGNPREITVFGTGLGGNFVNLHLFSLYEKLFQRAIIQSGSGLAPVWAITTNRKQYLLDLVSALGFNTSDIHDALKYLSSIDAHKLLKKETNIKAIGTKPCIEKKFEGVENFITEFPSNIVSSKARTTPVIIGHNDNEAAVWVNLIKDEKIPLYNFAFILLHEGFDNLIDAADTVKHFYIGDEKISVNVKSSLSNFVADFFYGSPIQRMVEQLVQDNASIVYRYIFSYSGGRNLQKKQHNLNSTGATHGDELGYLLDYNMFSGETTPKDQLMIDRMTTMWTNFAKFGNPIPKKTELLPIVWYPTTKTHHSFLDINSKLSLGAMPAHKRMAFWDLFYKLYGNTRNNIL